MSELPMRGNFRYLRFKTFSTTPRTPQCEVFCPLLSSSKHSGVPEDSNSQLFQVLGFTPTFGQSGVATQIPFPTCFLIGYLKPIVCKFYHVLAQWQVFGLEFDQFPKLSTSFLGFFHIALNITWTAPSLNWKYLLMHVHTSHQFYGYPLLSLCSW